MACGVAVVAAPVGVNCEIVEQNVHGKFATTPEEWEQALRSLFVSGPSVVDEMGRTGRSRVQDWYSLEIQAPKLLSLIVKAATK